MLATTPDHLGLYTISPMTQVGQLNAFVKMTGAVSLSVKVRVLQKQDCSMTWPSLHIPDMHADSHHAVYANRF